MKLQPIRHEDERRILIEYVSDIPFRRAKVLQTKGKVTLGKHYHENNDSVFYMLKGKAHYALKSSHDSKAITKTGWLFEGDCQFVPRNVIHTFEVAADSIMLECATLPYDEKDEIQVIE